MTVTDLRLGNILLGYDKKPFKWGFDHFKLCGDGIDADEIGMPILLTEDWLGKFGFLCVNKRSLRFKIYIGKKTSDAIYATLKTVGNNTEWYVSFNGFELRSIQYIHQLQNLYKELTNQELEIKNGSTKTT